MEPNKLKKKLIQLKYTEYLVQENENKLRVQKKKKAQAETDLSEAITLKEAAVEKGRQQKEELLQQIQVEQLLQSDSLQKIETKQEELQKIKLNFELSQSSVEQGIQTEIENKAKMEQELKQLEQDIDHYTNHQEEEIEIIRKKIAAVKQEQEKVKNDNNKIKSEYAQVEKKIAAIIETMDAKDVQDLETRLEMEKLHLIERPKTEQGNGLEIEIESSSQKSSSRAGSTKPTNSNTKPASKPKK